MKTDACLCTALRQAALAATVRYDEALAPSGLKITMYRLLKNAAVGEPPSITELAQRMGLERSTLGRNVRVLERDGLVTLAASGDGRERVVRLTDGGHEALASAVPLWRKAQRDLRRRLDGQTIALLDIAHRLDAG